MPRYNFLPVLCGGKISYNMTCIHTRSTLVEAMVNKEVDRAYCAGLFGDILGTSHVHEIPWTQPPNGQPGGKALFGDAQGTMLVLQRVRDLARQDTLDAACSARARKIRAVLRSVCDQLGDTSLKGFDAEQQLDDIQNKRYTRGSETHARRRLLVEDVEQEVPGDGRNDRDQHTSSLEEVRQEASYERHQDVLRNDDHVNSTRADQDAASGAMRPQHTDERDHDLDRDLVDKREGSAPDMHVKRKVRADGLSNDEHMQGAGEEMQGRCTVRVVDVEHQGGGGRCDDDMTDQQEEGESSDDFYTQREFPMNNLVRVTVKGVSGMTVINRIVYGKKFVVHLRYAHSHIRARARTYIHTCIVCLCFLCMPSARISYLTYRPHELLQVISHHGNEPSFTFRHKTTAFRRLVRYKTRPKDAMAQVLRIPHRQCGQRPRCAQGKCTPSGGPRRYASASACSRPCHQRRVGCQLRDSRADDKRQDSTPLQGHTEGHELGGLQCGAKAGRH